MVQRQHSVSSAHNDEDMQAEACKSDECLGMMSEDVRRSRIALHGDLIRTGSDLACKLHSKGQRSVCMTSHDSLATCFTHTKNDRCLISETVIREYVCVTVWKKVFPMKSQATALH
jgi:hypothetical protein